MGESWLRHTPVARTAELVTTETGDEILVYDQRTHHIHHLNATAAAVWRLCDGRRTAVEIAGRMDGVDLESVRQALGKLGEASLLEDALPEGFTVRSSSRRWLLKKAGIAAIPAVISVTVPLSSAHASDGTYTEDPEWCTQQGLMTLGSSCNQQAQCCSGFCDQAYPFGPGTCAAPPD